MINYGLWYVPETFCRHTVRASMVNPDAAAAPSTGEASDVAAPQTTATYRNVARHSAMMDRQSSSVRSSAWSGISTGRASGRHRRTPEPTDHLFRSSRSTNSSIMLRWWSIWAPSSLSFMMTDGGRREDVVRLLQVDAIPMYDCYALRRQSSA